MPSTPASFRFVRVISVPRKQIAGSQDRLMHSCLFVRLPIVDVISLCICPLVRGKQAMQQSGHARIKSYLVRWHPRPIARSMQ